MKDGVNILDSPIHGNFKLTTSRYQRNVVRGYNFRAMIQKRYRRIVFFSARILTGFILFDLIFPRIGFRNWSQRTRANRIRRSAVAFRLLAVQMGGVLIKVGQFLSTRVDVLPIEFTDELKGLQDEVPPVAFEDILKVAESELGCRLDEKYYCFDHEPLAAASLGQVHRATLKTSDAIVFSEAGNGYISDVVVKIQRPNIEKLIETDLAALKTVGNWLRRYPPIRKRADIPALINEFSRILFEEIDYLAEGRNAETFAGNFRESKGVRVPRVIWSHTTKRLLTLENVWAIKITDYDQITNAGISRADVASRLLDTYLKQIFEDGFFHADPHPGNLFVYPTNDQQDNFHNGRGPRWQLTFVDFGMVGRLPANTKEGMREMLIGVGTQDAARVVQSYKKLGVLLPNADLALIERAEARVFERFWGKSMTELSQIGPEEIREFTAEFRDLLYSMPFQIPHDFIFLARAIGILSGMCTGLDPDFNVWDHLTPYAAKLIAEEARSSRDFWLDELKSFFTALYTYPIKMNSMIAKIERGEISVRTPDVVKQINRLELAIRQTVAGIIFLALFIGAVQIYLAGQLIPALILAVIAFTCLVWLFAQGFWR